MRLNHQGKRLLMAVCWLGALALPAWAGEALTWQDCVQEALAHNPDLVSAREKIRQARGSTDIAGAGRLPQVSADLTGQRSKTEPRSAADSFSYGVTAQQLVFDGFKTNADVKSARKTMDAAAYDYEVVSSDLRLNLRTAFAALLRAQQLTTLTEEIVKRRTDNLELVRLRYEAGREHKGALLTAQADLAEAEFESSQAGRNLILTQRALNKLLHRDVRRPVLAAGDFLTAESADPRVDFEALAETTPLLREVVAKKEAAKLNYQSSKADLFPQIYLNSSIGRTDGDWPPTQKEWTAGVKVTLPLFEGGKRVAQIAKARAQWAQAQADEDSSRDGVIYTLSLGWKDFQDAVETVAVKEKFLEAAQERAVIANAQYSTGFISFDDWIIIENNLVSARKTYLDAQANMLTAEAAWVQAKGGTLEYAQE